VITFFKKKRPKQFGEVALDKGLVSEQDISEVLRIQREYIEKHNIHKKIGTILSDKGILTQEDIEIILEEQKKQTGPMAWFWALLSKNR